MSSDVISRHKRAVAAASARAEAMARRTAPLVHFCDYARQLEIVIFCTGEGTIPAWGEHLTGDPDVFVAENGKLYTFDAAKVTCAACNKKARAQG